jgi:hypothetical protein
MAGEFKQIRDNRGQVLGYIRKDEKSGVTHIYGKDGVTIGWGKEDDNCGPGYTIMSRGNQRVAHSFVPEYLLGLQVSAEKAKQLKESPRSAPTISFPFKSMGTDGSYPKYQK